MKRWLTRPLLVVINIVFAFVLREAGLWLLGIEYPDFFDYDPSLAVHRAQESKGISSKREAATP